jgi:hypothetical protein
MQEELSQELCVGHLFKQRPADTQRALEQPGQASLDHQELQSIVNNLVKLPEEPRTPEAVKIARITHHEINAMRISQSKMPATRIEQKARANALIQTMDAFVALFKQQERRSRCLLEGHECKHCGQVLKSEPAKAAAESRGH